MFPDPIYYYLLLIVTGVIAGFINTLAGGGSNLTIPALMVLGMPPDIANATNRVGVFLQGVAATNGFNKHGVLEMADAKYILLITLSGGIIGALVASYLPNLYLKPVLLGSMILMALIILIRPSTIVPPTGTPVLKAKETPQAWVGLFVAGLYGGFVQAGVGFLLIGAIAGTLRYDLVRTNALKMLCTLIFTSAALAIFVLRDQVVWMPGLMLGIGCMIGAHYSVRVAIKVSQNFLKQFLFVMTLAACAAAYFS
jgi:hypothetical protein